MRFGPLFARGETLAIRRNATDGTPPSGVAKNNPHQYTKALWQRMVAVLCEAIMGWKQDEVARSALMRR